MENFFKCINIKIFIIVKRLRFAAALLPQLFENSIPGHTAREPQVGFELATKGIQLYVIANVDKTSIV